MERHCDMSPCTSQHRLAFLNKLTIHGTWRYRAMATTPKEEGGLLLFTYMGSWMSTGTEIMMVSLNLSWIWNYTGPVLLHFILVVNHLATWMERISSKKNRVSCCDLHCLSIFCTRFAFSLLNLCLHLSQNPPHPFIMFYDLPRQTLHLPHSIFLNLGVSNLGVPRCLKWTWSVSIIRRARQFELIQDTDVSGKLITSTNSGFDPSGWVADIEQTVEPEARSLAIQDIGAILQA